MICLNHIHYEYGELPVLEELSFSLQDKSITCLLGPSGCGKTTLLNLISGNLPCQRGDISGLPVGHTAYLFQEPRLLPWKTLERNLDLVLRRIYPPEKRSEIIEEILTLVELRDFAAFYPHQLSGGMRQRGALARAFALPSELLLMDEPFQALDPALKLGLINVFRRLWERDRRTALLVTHNIQEATLLGDHILVLSRRPARLLKKIANPVLREERFPYSEGVLALERELHLTLMEERKEPNG